MPETLAALNAPVDVLPPPLKDPPMPETSLLPTEQKEDAVSSFLTSLRQNVITAEVRTQTDPPPQSPLITDLSCPVHEWEPLCLGSCGEFHHERCGKEGCLVFSPTQAPGKDVERIERSSPLRVETAMGILALQVRVETPHVTEFVGKELSKDLSDLRGEPARRGGIWQSPLSVFPVDPLETVPPERAAARAGVTGKGEAVEGRVRSRRALQHHPIPRRIPKFGFSSVPHVRVRRHESLSRMENRDVHGSHDPVPERGRALSPPWPSWATSDVAPPKKPTCPVGASWPLLEKPTSEVAPSLPKLCPTDRTYRDVELCFFLKTCH